MATLLIAEMAAYYKTRSMTLIDARDELFEKYGYFREEVFSIGMSGADAQEKMAALMKNLRKNPPREIGGKAIATVKDYLTEKTLDVQTGAISGTGLPKSDVLWYLTEDGNLIVVRPSGTEPKVKVYVLANGKTDEITKECARVCAAGIREILG